MRRATAREAGVGTRWEWWWSAANSPSAHGLPSPPACLLLPRVISKPASPMSCNCGPRACHAFDCSSTGQTVRHCKQQDISVLDGTISISISISSVHSGRNQGRASSRAQTVRPAWHVRGHLIEEFGNGGSCMNSASALSPAPGVCKA